MDHRKLVCYWKIGLFYTIIYGNVTNRTYDPTEQNDRQKLGKLYTPVGFPKFSVEDGTGQKRGK